MLTKSLFSIANKIPRLATKFTRPFTIFQRSLIDENPHLLDDVLNLYSTKMKKIMLDRSVLEKNKILVPAMRVRRPEDTLEFLRTNKLCAGKIEAREEFEDLDLVFEQKQAHWLMRTKDCFVRPFHVQVGEEKIRCTLDEINRHFAKKWIIQVKFKRYIVGRPNLVWLPLKLKWDTAHSFESAQPNFLNMEGMWVYCYNDDYPTCLEVEVGNVDRTIGLRLGDYIRTLPDGVEAHSKYKKDLSRRMIEFLPPPADTVREKEQVTALKIRLQKEEAGLITEVDADEEEELDEGEKAKREERKRRDEERKAAAKARGPRSLKKRVQAMGLKIKEGLAQDEGEKKPAKGGKKEG